MLAFQKIRALAVNPGKGPRSALHKQPRLAEAGGGT